MLASVATPSTTINVRDSPGPESRAAIAAATRNGTMARPRTRNPTAAISRLRPRSRARPRIVQVLRPRSATIANSAVSVSANWYAPNTVRPRIRAAIKISANRQPFSTATEIAR
jgi:hypothetical protein